jgi:hypothetical protein
VKEGEEREKRRTSSALVQRPHRSGREKQEDVDVERASALCRLSV